MSATARKRNRRTEPTPEARAKGRAPAFYLAGGDADRRAWDAQHTFLRLVEGLTPHVPAALRELTDEYARGGGAAAMSKRAFLVPAKLGRSLPARRLSEKIDAWAAANGLGSPAAQWLMQTALESLHWWALFPSFPMAFNTPALAAPPPVLDSWTGNSGFGNLAVEYNVATLRFPARQAHESRAAWLRRWIGAAEALGKRYLDDFDNGAREVMTGAYEHPEAQQHIEWLVRRNVLGESWTVIARRAGRDRAGVIRRTREAADLLGLAVRQGRSLKYLK